MPRTLNVASPALTASMKAKKRHTWGSAPAWSSPSASTTVMAELTASAVFWMFMSVIVSKQRCFLPSLRPSMPNYAEQTRRRSGGLRAAVGNGQSRCAISAPSPLRCAFDPMTHTQCACMGRAAHLRVEQIVWVVVVDVDAGGHRLDVDIVLQHLQRLEGDASRR